MYLFYNHTQYDKIYAEKKYDEKSYITWDLYNLLKVYNYNFMKSAGYMISKCTKEINYGNETWKHILNVL